MMPADRDEAHEGRALEELADIEARARRFETSCGDGAMVWRVWGECEAAPLVLAHGAQGSWNHWIRNIDRLSRKRCLIVPDLPGHGDSAMPATPDHPGIARALSDGLEEIAGSAPLDICGFSFGGVAMAHLAAFHPHRVRHLVIVGCGGLDTPMGHPRLGKVSGLTGAARRQRLKDNLLGLMLCHPDSADALAVAMLLPTAKQARLHVPPLVIPDRLIRILPEVRAPVDAIWGENDLPHPDPAVQEAALRKVLTGMEFRTVPEAGHWAQYERPEVFEDALLSLLEARNPVLIGR